MYRMKVTVHKIRSCSTKCVVEFENDACLIWMDMQPSVEIPVDYANTSVFCASPTSRFIVDVSNRAPSSFSFSSVIKGPVSL
jgi:hypothetical protein